MTEHIATVDIVIAWVQGRILYFQARSLKWKTKEKDERNQ
jgi:hypothetical protein